MRLLHHYKLDNNNTDSVSGNNLILQGGVAYADGVNGKCLNCDTAGKSVMTTNTINVNGNISFSFWFKTPLPTAADGWRSFIWQNGAQHFCIVHIDGHLGTYNEGFFYDCGFDMLTLSNGWHHMVVVANQTSFTTSYYIDGSFVGSTATKITGNTLIQFGNAGSNQWVGYIDDIRVYNYCLTLKEIKELSKGLILHESMRENSSKYHVNATLYSSFNGAFRDESYNYVIPRNIEWSNVNTKLGSDRFGRMDRSASFDGTAYLDLGNYATTSAVTYSAWVKIPDTIPARMIAVDHGANARILDMHSYNDWEVNIGRAGSWISATHITPPEDYRGKWVMITFTIDYTNGSAKYYINGVNTNTWTFTGGDNATSYPMRLGQYSLGESGYKFTGSIDEFMVFNTALPETYVTYLYNITKKHKLNEPINSDGFPDFLKYCLWGVGNECAVSYDVVNEYVGTQDTFTLSCYVKDVLQSSGDMRVGWYGGNYKGPYILINNTGVIGFSIGQGNTSGSWSNYDSGAAYQITDNNQHHIALQYDGAYVRLFVDGIERFNHNIGVYIDSGDRNQNFRIGGTNPWDNWGIGCLGQKMYDVKLFHRALTTAQILEEATTKVSINEKNIAVCNSVSNGLNNLLVHSKSLSDTKTDLNTVITGYPSISQNGMMEFDGTNDAHIRYNVGNFEQPRNVTFSFWDIPKSTGDTAVLTYGGILITLNTLAITVWANVGYATYSVARTFSGTEPEHVVIDFSWDTNTVNFYVNGSLISSQVLTAPIWVNTETNWWVGCYGINGGAQNRWFIGELSDVKIYYKIFTENEIAKMYHNEKSISINKVTGLTGRTLSVKGSGRGLMFNAPLNNKFYGVTSGAYLVTGRDNNSQSAYYFDGVDDYLRTDEDYYIDSRYRDYTINVWVKPEYNSGNHLAVLTDANSDGYNGASWGIWIAGGLDGIYTWASGFAGSAAPITGATDGNWHMISVVYHKNLSGWTLTDVYWDGIYVGHSSFDRTSPITFTIHFGLGCSYVGYETNYKGYMSDVRVYERELTAIEILKMYQSNKISFDKNLIVNKIIEN